MHIPALSTNSFSTNKQVSTLKYYIGKYSLMVKKQSILNEYIFDDEKKLSLDSYWDIFIFYIMIRNANLNRALQYRQCQKLFNETLVVLDIKSFYVIISSIITQYISMIIWDHITINIANVLTSGGVEYG